MSRVRTIAAPAPVKCHRCGFVVRWERCGRCELADQVLAEIVNSLCDAFAFALEEV